MSVEICLLGHVEVVVDGEPVGLGHTRQRSVFGALALTANRTVSTDGLTARIWGDRPPQRARGTVHSYVSRLRTVLAPVPGVEIRRGCGGYLLSAPPDAVDVVRFRALVRGARDAARPDHACLALEDALGLWRGEPLAPLDSPWSAAARDELAGERHQAEVDRHDALLRLGRHAELVGPLSRLTDEHPWDERLTGQRMLALCRSGRRADALDVYQALRRRLADDLGVDPGPQLRQLHGRILRSDPEVLGPRTAQAAPPDTAPSAPAAAPARVTVPAPATVPAAPRQLPVRTVSFVGRTAETAVLDRTLGADRGDEDGTPLVVITGGGGLGKTWLALHWAGDNADRFPDGQLYADLAGFDPAQEPGDPAAALRGFLTALGVEPGRMPVDICGLSTAFRSITAGRRMLVVLDNVRDADAVVPLLPGIGGSAVLVTSRRRLTGLAVTHGARTLDLRPLPPADARDLLVRRLTRGPSPAERAAVDEIVGLCGGLPLALAVAAARLDAGSAAALAEELRDETSRLDALDGGGGGADLRTVLGASRRALAPGQAAVFDLLGLFPGPEVSLSALASVAALPRAGARTAADELVAAGLLYRAATDRYRIHDLVRLYAREHFPAGGPAGEPLTRLLDHYLHTSHGAALRLSPKREPMPLPPPAPSVLVDAVADADTADEWFTAEFPSLVAAVAVAGARGLHVRAHQLAWTVATYCGHHRIWQEWVGVAHVAVTSAERSSDPAAHADATRLLANAYSTGHRFDEAHVHYLRALDLFATVDDPAGEAQVHFDVALLLDRQGRPADALPHAARALDRYRAAGHDHGAAVALNALGWYHCETGDHERGLAYCREALSAARRIGSVYCESNALDSLGYAHHHLGRYADAVNCYRGAIALLRAMGDRISCALALDHLGDSLERTGQVASARVSWQEALDFLEQSGHPQAEPVRRKLSGRTDPV